MKFHFITLFPELIESAAKAGVVGQALEQGLISLECYNPRSMTSNAHHSVDDRPFGGGDGMLMTFEPLAKTVAQVKHNISKSHPQTPSRDEAQTLVLAQAVVLEHARGSEKVNAQTEAHAPASVQISASVHSRRVRVVHLSPRGMVLNDAKMREFANEYDDLILISSRYAGVDQRFINEFVDEEISIGDYVISGGELAALVIFDGVSRLLPKVLGNSLSSHVESFQGDRLEPAQFTRPSRFEFVGESELRVARTLEVPKVLISGDHARIRIWQEAIAALTTLVIRPDLVQKKPLSKSEIKNTKAVLGDSNITDSDFEVCGLPSRAELIQRFGC
jgi:tRNA (guanine37-N1)-methyltransferase